MGRDPLGFVISKNLHRRHLTESQRAMVAASIATAKQGQRTDLEPSRNSGKVTQQQAADMLDVSVDSVAAAKVVKESGVPELVEAVVGKDGKAYRQAPKADPEKVARKYLKKNPHDSDAYAAKQCGVKVTVVEKVRRDLEEQKQIPRRASAVSPPAAAEPTADPAPAEPVVNLGTAGKCRDATRKRNRPGVSAGAVTSGPSPPAPWYPVGVRLFVLLPRQRG